MALTKSQRYIYQGLLAVIALAFLDLVVLEPYFDARRELIDQRNTKQRSIEEGQSILQHEKELRQLVSGMSASLAADPSTVEGQFLHLMHDWEQQAGISSASFQRSYSNEEHGFTRLMFQISGTGNVSAVGELLYRVETAAIPLRVDSAQVRAKSDGGDDVQFILNISTPCQAKANEMPVAAETKIPEGSG